MRRPRTASSTGGSTGRGGGDGLESARVVTRHERFALAAFALILAVFGWQGLTDSDGSLRPEQDHTITLSLSRQLETYHEYHPDFIYPLPAVVMKLALGQLGSGPSSVLWMALLIAAGVGCVHALSLLWPPAAGRHRYAAPLLGALAIAYCLQWDYRAVNANTLFLALVLFAFVALERGRDGAAGALLAASVALKLYSAPLLVLFALRGRGRAVAWTCAWGLVFFGLAPALWFGPGAAWQLSGLWIDQMVATASAEAASRVTAYNVSLGTVMHALFDREGAPSSLAALSSRAIALAFACAVALWIGRRRGDFAADPPRASTALDTLIGVGLGLAAMLLLSPLAQPHHGVVLWPLAAVTAGLALDPAATSARRRATFAILGAVFLALIAAPSGLGKAIALNAAIGLLGAGGILAAASARAPVSPPAPDRCPRSPSPPSTRAR